MRQNWAICCSGVLGMPVCWGTNRTDIFDAGILPNIKEHPRKRTKRGRKRWFNAAIHAVRARVERTLA